MSYMAFLRGGRRKIVEFVPARMFDGTVIIIGNFSAVRLPDAADTTTRAQWRVPPGAISFDGIDLELYLSGAGGSGNGRLGTGMTAVKSGDAITGSQLGVTPQTVNVGGVDGQVRRFSMPVRTAGPLGASGAFDSTMDFVNLAVTREATDPLDTYAGFMDLLGLYLKWTVDLSLEKTS